MRTAGVSVISKAVYLVKGSGTPLRQGKYYNTKQEGPETSLNKKGGEIFNNACPLTTA